MKKLPKSSKHIYNAMVALVRQNVCVDMMTIVAQLKRDGKLEECGGMSYIVDLLYTDEGGHP